MIPSFISRQISADFLWNLWKYFFCLCVKNHDVISNALSCGNSEGKSRGIPKRFVKSIQQKLKIKVVEKIKKNWDKFMEDFL